MLFQPIFPWLPALILLVSGGMLVTIRQRNPAFDRDISLWEYLWGMTAAGALLRLIVWTVWFFNR